MEICTHVEEEEQRLKLVKDRGDGAVTTGVDQVSRRGDSSVKERKRGETDR